MARAAPTVLPDQFGAYATDLGLSPLIQTRSPQGPAEPKRQTPVEILRGCPGLPPPSGSLAQQRDEDGISAGQQGQSIVRGMMMALLRSDPKLAPTSPSGPADSLRCVGAC
jgi:hypothetical protein